ncbi:hypothetical protein HN371_28630 [Candidatus Poribacteria bacterium]|jgi:hypothetical protein|nr:hypothetical protein [Candidatus Poribacteria bacterium]MBT5536841.1 hypothetical protein [Candidatus Poribacteria bacterium]MBT5712649.1 hypothetical protein [Candidatus Poribacteria bacterium]MBT7100046.1 hypothetical protein [Candidatus Poribacteria bacterium]MBT7807037.1 hypothetical protein [Candidatus Poribacteria bacterium]
MSRARHHFPSLVLVALLAAFGCGEATHTLVESPPVLIGPTGQLPNDLVGRAELIVLSPDGGVTAVVDRVHIILREDQHGVTTATVTASGTLSARVPADILLFEVVLEPSHPGAAWSERDGLGAKLVDYPTQLAAGERGSWHWQAQATTDDHIAEGLIVRARLVYEALL